MGDHLIGSDYEVRPIDIDRARSLVVAHHYAGGASKTATDLHGLYLVESDEPVGVAWWLPTTKVAAQSVSDDWRRVTSLSRLVVEPGQPTNAASYLIGRSIRRLRKEGRWTTLVTWADEGEGHTGQIYRATNWEYLGMTAKSYRYRHPGGRLMSPKRGAKTFSRKEMLEQGYTLEGPFRKHKFRMVL